MKLIYALEERIGNPDLFWGRKKELEYLVDWVDEIPRKINKPIALLSRSKKGKTAIVERLYNIVYTKNNHIIPFYYEVREYPYWVIDFAKEFYLSFVQQYIAFKIRKPEITKSRFDINLLRALADENELEAIVEDIFQMEELFTNSQNESEIVFYSLSAPNRIASITGDFVLQIIDEFQLLTSQIYLDRERSKIFPDLINSYATLSKSKNAPIIATGSKLGWLKEIMHEELSSHFIEFSVGNFDENEGIGAVINYFKYNGEKIDVDKALIVSILCENDPYYINCVVNSNKSDKSYESVSDIIDILEYEITKGSIYLNWKTYFEKILKGNNNEYLKNIVIFLTKNSKQEYDVKQIISECDLNLTNEECENLLEKLIKGDLIQKGKNRFLYKGIEDDVLIKILLFEYMYDGDYDRYLPKLIDFRTELTEKISSIDLKSIVSDYNLVRDEINYSHKNGIEKLVSEAFKEIRNLFKIKEHDNDAYIYEEEIVEKDKIGEENANV